VKLNTRNRQLLLLKICEFREIRRSDGCTFLTTVNDVTVTSSMMKPYDILKVKNALLKHVSYVTKSNSSRVVILQAYDAVHLTHSH